MMNDEDLDFYRAKVWRIANGKDQDHTPWAVAFGAKEIQPIIERLDKAEAERDFLLQSIKPGSDGYVWEPRDWDYRCQPGEVLRWAMASRKQGRDA